MRRRLIIGAAYLLFGVVAAVAVAWACALWVQKPVLGSTRLFDGAAEWPLPVADGWPDGPNALFEGRKAGYVIFGAQTLALRSRPTRRLIERNRLEIHDLGWPLPALRWHRRTGPEGVSDHGALPVPAALEITGQPDRRLPAWPRWGMLVDALVFAGLGWLAVGGPLAAQRAVRGWHGSCLACGYDLRASRGSRCPECGQARGTTAASVDASPKP